MSVKERILALRVLEQLRRFPDTAAKLGVEGSIKKQMEDTPHRTTVPENI